MVNCATTIAYTHAVTHIHSHAPKAHIKRSLTGNNIAWYYAIVTCDAFVQVAVTVLI